MTMSADDQHRLGKLTAEERTLLLCDEGSFLGEATEGLVTGRGEIHGRTVFVFASDQSHAGSFHAAQATRLIALHQAAIDAQTPIIGFFDSDGHRLRDDLSWFEDYGALLQMQTEARGKSLQLAIIAGPCISAGAILAAAMDLHFMIADTARFYVTGPAILDEFADHPLEETFGEGDTAAKYGLVDALYNDEITAISEARRLIDFTARDWQSFDAQDRQDIALEKLVPDDPAASYDIRDIIMRIVDEGDVFELSRRCAENALTCFARLGGQTVGIMANQPCTLGGALDVKALQKFHRFAQLCADNSWPLLSLIDAPGFLPQANQQEQNIAGHAAKLFSVLARSQNPKLSLVVGQAYGTVFNLMAAGSQCLAWPSARFGMMKAEGATYSAQEAKARELVTEVIEPQETRRHLIAALSSLKEER